MLTQTFSDEERSRDTLKLNIGSHYYENMRKTLLELFPINMDTHTQTLNKIFVNIHVNYTLIKVI